MKITLATFIFLLPIVMGAACDHKNPSPADGNGNTVSENIELMSDTIVVKIGSTEFTATLVDNPTAAAFKAMLPLTMNMTELNGNEKYFDLPESLPADSSNPGKINAGDLLLYGTRTLVLFYESFSTFYSYTKLGKIDNPGGLAKALGSGNAEVTMELK
jgi:hypothetical protein